MQNARIKTRMTLDVTRYRSAGFAVMKAPQRRRTFGGSGGWVMMKCVASAAMEGIGPKEGAEAVDEQECRFNTLSGHQHHH